MAVAQSTPAPFIWGPNGEMLTPDEVEKMRQQAEALKAAGMDYSPVGSWLEGLARVAQAGVGAYKEYKADNAQKEGQQAWNDKYGGIISSLMGGGSTGAPMTSGYAPSASSGGMPSAGIHGTPGGISDTKSPVFAEVAPRLIGDLSRDFGLSPQQAAGVVGQLGHESAGFGTLQEVNPTLPGSRGGYGYAQWTGPRRKQFEAFTAANQLDPTSYEANYGFLANELKNTPESAVLQKLAAAPDAMTAGRVFTDEFLRPGIPGYDSRDNWTKQALAYADPALMPAQAELEAMVAAPEEQVIPGDAWVLPGGANPRAPQAAPSPQAREVALALAGPQGGQMPAPAAQPQRPVNTAGLNYDPATGAIGPAANLGPGATLAPAASQAFLGNGQGGSWSDPIRSIAQSLAGGGQPQPTQAAPSMAAPGPVGGAPASMPSQPAQPTGMTQGNNIGALIAAASDPYAPPGVKEIVNTLVQQQLQQQDPAYRMGLEKSQLELEQLRNPRPDYDIITGKDGSIFRADKRIGSVEQVYGGKPDKPTDVQEYEYAKQQGFPGSFVDFQIAQKRAGASQVNIDQKAEGAFDKKLAEKQAESFDVMATEGMNARGDLAVIGELGALMQGRGGTLDGLSGTLAKYGIGGEGVGDIQAAQALINRLVPTQRQPGSGSMSDRDVELFTRSLPSLWNQPGGNERIISTMQGLAQYKLAQGDIAQRVMMGEIDRQTATKMLRELKNPLEGFKAPSSASPTPTGNSRSTLGLDRKPPVIINGYQIEEVN